MEHDDLGAAGGCDAGAPVERPDGGGELAALGLEVAHEAEERCVHGQHDVGRARRFSEPLRPRVIHPEPAFEVDLAGVVPALEQDLDRVLRVVAGRDAGQADTDSRHGRDATGRGAGLSTAWTTECASLRGV